MDNKKIVLRTISGMLLCTMIAYMAPTFAYTKDETVYSKLKSNGENYQTIVSTHLTNSKTEKILEDLTNLLNIKNTNGDETFTQDGDSIVWDSNGNDIYYQGESEKELPISCKITYTLDGKEIEPKDLAGKSGKVKITLTYTNNDSHMVEINGMSTKMYTPFVVVAGTAINNEKNKNIEISNGKIMDDGSKTIVVGIAVPGMQESLNISKDKIDLPSTIEISMDATDFELESIATFVTPKILEDEDLKIFDKLDEIYDKVKTLEDSSNEIEKGADSLKKGTDTYYEKSKEFNTAMNQVSQGMSSANDNYTKIDEGINSINSNSTKLKDGAKGISDGTKAVQSNLETISEKLGDAQTGSESVKAGIKQIKTGVSTILAGVNQMAEGDTKEKIEELETLISGNKSALEGLTNTNLALEKSLEGVPETDTDTIKKINAQIESNKKLIYVLEQNVLAEQETINSLIETGKSIQTLQKGLSNVKDGLENLENGSNGLTSGISQLKDGASTLAEKSKELTKGADSLYQGTAQLKEGTATLATGSNQLKEGFNTLDSSTTKLVNANNQLTEGAKTLQNGSIKLAEGIHTFNIQGIKPICNYINGDLQELAARAEKLSELSKEYNNFTMLKDKQKGNVKFIIMTDGIKIEEKDEEK